VGKDLEGGGSGIFMRVFSWRSPEQTDKVCTNLLGAGLQTKNKRAVCIDNEPYFYSEGTWFETCPQHCLCRLITFIVFFNSSRRIPR
jgi:hypothetical protein